MVFLIIAFVHFDCQPCLSQKVNPLDRFKIAGDRVGLVLVVVQAISVGEVGRAAFFFSKTDLAIDLPHPPRSWRQCQFLPLLANRHPPPRSSSRAARSLSSRRHGGRSIISFFRPAPGIRPPFPFALRWGGSGLGIRVGGGKPNRFRLFSTVCRLQPTIAAIVASD